MSKPPKNTNEDVIQDFLSVADLLKEPHLAQVYSYLVREGDTTVLSLMESLDLPRGTAYTYVNRLENAGVITATTEEQPQTYAAVEVDLTLTTPNDDHEYTITPALIDAVSRRVTIDDIDQYIDRHGIGSLATALTYAIAQEQGEVTHRLMARDLDLSLGEAETILQALWPVVRAHTETEDAGVSFEEVTGTEEFDTDFDDT